MANDVTERKLVINETEAKTVRAIFEAFVELGSVQATVHWAREQGLKTKLRQRASKPIGGTPFHYGALRCLLSNRTYVGEVEHKDKVYPGQHGAILDRALFDRAQAILASRSTEQMRVPKLASASLIQGMIFDQHGRKMGPAHTCRNGQRFRYYVTHAKQIEIGGPAAYRVAAEAIEQHCAAILTEYLAAKVTSIEGADAAKLIGTTDGERRMTFLQHIRRVVIGDAELTIKLADGSTIKRALDRVWHGNDAKLIVGGQPTSDQPAGNQQLIILPQDAARAQAFALAMPKLSLNELAARFGRSSERFKRLIRLSYLSPKIVEAIILARQPTELTSRSLQNLDGLPLRWREQEAMLLI